MVKFLVCVFMLLQWCFFFLNYMMGSKIILYIDIKLLIMTICVVYVSILYLTLEGLIISPKVSLMNPNLRLNECHS